MAKQTQSTGSHKGTVLSMSDGIVYADGLSEVGANQLVNIYTAELEIVKGIALNLDPHLTGIVCLGEYKNIKQGDTVEATGQVPTINVSAAFLGRVINPLGEPLDGEQLTLGQQAKPMTLDKIAPGVIERVDVTRPLQTGILAIDGLIPIGRGQRELIIGDKQTGKTALAIDTIINQRGKDCYCIYVAIGQKQSKIAQVIAKLKEYDALSYTVIISAPASEPAALQYLAAYTATAIGEYFAEQGQDALVIYDDLTKHAQAYREISLLLERPSGREAYPGDIFYLHSKILERAVQYRPEAGGGSLTALPIIETQAGDISAYIPTNVISITDGQIFLEQGLFNAGQRPAIAVGSSVSRVGGAAQTKGLKQVAGPLKLDLAQYRELASFAQFGSDLDPETKKRLDRGDRLQAIMRQEQYRPRSVAEMIALTYAATNEYLKDVSLEMVASWVEEFQKRFGGSKLAVKLNGEQKIEADLEKELQEFINAYNQEFMTINNG